MGTGGSPIYEVISQKIFNFTNDGFPMWHTCCGFLVACSKGRRMKTMFSQILGFGLAFKTQKLKKSLAPPMATHHL